MTKLTLLIHGRSASTLMLRMLYETNQFKLWGTPPTGECTPFRNKPHTWNKATIIKEWKKTYTPGDHILAKLPAFAFFIEKMLILKPDIIVLERPIIDIVRSYAAVGWIPRLHGLHAQIGVDVESTEKYEELGGHLHDGDPHHLLGVIYSYSHWKTRLTLRDYPRALTVHYQELMTTPDTVFTQLEDFLGLETGTHRANWRRLMKKRHQATGRSADLEYHIPLPVKMPPSSIDGIEDAVQRFESI